MLCGSLGTKSGSPCKMKMPCMWHVHHKEPELCPICMEDVGTRVYETNCSHQFHHDCLLNGWKNQIFVQCADHQATHLSNLKRQCHHLQLLLQASTPPREADGIDDEEEIEG